jgi:glycosyltransferase involved in cell wall biosynthesis
MSNLVSILIPCHNAARFLAETLTSALAQTWPATEIIVVDDGSTDGSLQELQRFAPLGVRVIEQTNKGAAAARNRALAASRGEFIQFLDADDLIGADKIATQIDVLRRAGVTKVSSCPWARFTTGTADARFTPEAVWRDLSAIDFLVTCALEELMFPPAAWLIPRSVCEAAGPWDETLSMNDDGEYMARVVAASEGIVFSEAGRVYYRSGNPLSYGSVVSERAADSELRAWDSIVETMTRVETSDRVKRAAATGYQRIQARYFGKVPAIVEQARQRERAYGRGAYRFTGGRLFRAAVDVLGWKTAMRLRLAKGAITGSHLSR